MNNIFVIYLMNYFTSGIFCNLLVVLATCIYEKVAIRKLRCTEDELENGYQQAFEKVDEMRKEGNSFAKWMLWPWPVKMTFDIIFWWIIVPLKVAFLAKGIKTTLEEVKAEKP